MNNIKIFENPEFGSIRTVEHCGETWFVSKDVAKALGYRDTADALKKHVDVEDKRLLKPGEMPTLKMSNYGAYVINESGLYSLILSSKLPTAKKFKHWVTSEVLPSIRKTGGYNTDKIIQTMVEFMSRQQEFNKTIIELLKYQNTTPEAITYPEIGCTTEEIWLTATEVGRLLGMSKSMVGYIANLYGLKTPEYGAWFLEEYPHSNRARGVFRYNSRAIEQIKKVCKVRYTYP